LLSIIFKMIKMLKEWRWSTMILLNKSKDDIQNYNNYRGISCYVILQKIGREWWRWGEEECVHFRELVHIHASAILYRSQASCEEMVKKYQKIKNNLQMVSLTLKRCLRKVLLRCLEASGVQTYIRAINVMFDEIKIWVRTM